MEFPTPLIKAMDAVLASSDLGTLTKWNKAQSLLVEAQIAYDTTCKWSEMWVHPKNRAGLGLNPHNAHKNFAVIVKSGADKDYLSKATAFEMKPRGSAGRDAQSQFNFALIESAKGLLASPTGAERLLTVSCSHFSAACRAAIANCITSEPSIADPDGRLNVMQICKDNPVLRDILDNGIVFKVFPYQVEERWPSLPDLAQAALNVTHATISEASELQCMATAAQLASGMRETDGSVPWTAVGAAVCAEMPPCRDYVSKLVDYVRLFGGGHDAPMIHYLDGFAKEFGVNLKLGESFWTALVGLNFGTATNLFPYLRNAVVATNLTSPPSKITDGIARMLVKSDLVLMCKKEKRIQNEAAEALLADAWAKLGAAVKAGIISSSKQHVLMGRLATRIVLFLCNKQNDSPEGVEYETFAQIRDKFQTELGEATGSGTAAAGAKTEMGKATEYEAPTTTEDASNPQYLAKQSGFNIGSFYMHKGAPYELTEMSAEGCKLKRYNCVDNTMVWKVIPFDDLKKELTPHKGKLQVKLALDDRRPWTFANLEANIQFKLKAELFVAMMEAAARNEDIEKTCLDFYFTPNEVRTKVECTKGSIKLLCCTDATKMWTKSATSNHKAEGPNGSYFILEKPSAPSDDKSGAWGTSCCLVGFWWVRTTEDEADGNMKLTKAKIGNWTVPMLENTKKIPSGCRLLLHKPAERPAKKLRK